MKNGLVVHASGTQEWYENGQLHRIDGPAIIHASGTQAWYVYGQRHRTDGPTIIHADGTEEWWVDDGWLDRPIYRWVQDHCQQQNVGQEDLDWVQIDTVTQFVSEEDATMFQMVWG